MSFVGPRPLLVKYLKLYNSTQKLRHHVKPGITGLAQIKGRNSLSWSKKLEYDVIYKEKLNFLLDLKIIFLSFLIVLKRKGISGKNSVTMQEFKGN